LQHTQDKQTTGHKGYSHIHSDRPWLFDFRQVK
jgi:hypothetical protein